MICATVKHGIHAFFPCKHAVSCESCCQSLLLKDKPRCPYCDKKIDSFHSINLNWISHVKYSQVIEYSWNMIREKFKSDEKMENEFYFTKWNLYSNSVISYIT